MSTYPLASKTVEKIVLKPTFQELLYKTQDKNSNFDVLSCTVNSYQERNLGHLFMLGNVAYEEGEDMAYIVNLILSLGKREYYSKQSLVEQDPRIAFERTLKKLNEVLENFFTSKDLKLDIGLAAVAGDTLLISRIGKLKVSLARNGEHIDVINNVDLFSKEYHDNMQFSNVISGKVRPGDKLFAYIPFRSMTTREKILKTQFINEDQDAFGQKISQFAESHPETFSCCGVHITINEVKEIPVTPVATTASQELPIDKDVDLPITAAPQEKPPIITTAYTEQDIEEIEGDAPEQSKTESSLARTEQTITARHLSSMISTGISVGTRANLASSLTNQISKLRNMSTLTTSGRMKGFAIIAAIVLVPLLGYVGYTSFGSSPSKTALATAKENKKLADAKISQGDTKEGRALLQAALSGILEFDGGKIDTIKQEIKGTLATIDKPIDKQPTLYSDLGQHVPGKQFSKIGIIGENVIVVSKDKDIAAVPSGGFSELGKAATEPAYLLGEASKVGVFNGNDTIDLHNITNKKSDVLTLKSPVTSNGATVYKENLYTLASDAIYKYSDALKGGDTRAQWGSLEPNTQPISLAIDGTIYILTADGKLISYFKGQKSKEYDLGIQPSEGSKILTSEDGVAIYLADKKARSIYIFNKSDGTLQGSYKLESIGAIEDISIDSKDTLWLLSSDSKIYSL